MDIKSRILGIELVEWRKLKDLQPDNIKLPQNYDHIKRSIKKHGFSQPFFVWENKNEYFTIDGHTRKTVMLEMAADGENIPEKLHGVLIDAKNKKEAIKILLDVYNQRHNQIAGEVLYDWLNVEEIEPDEVNIESLDVSIDHENNKIDKKPGDQDALNTVTVEYQSEGEKIKLLKFLRQLNFSYQIN